MNRDSLTENKYIYLVVYSYYSDWEVYGYFTDEIEAQKYCVAKLNADLHVMKIPCYDQLVNKDFLKLSLSYKFTFVMRKDDKSWALDKYSIEDPNYTYFERKEFLPSNKLFTYSSNNTWIGIEVNINEFNADKARKIALDIWYQYLDFCNDNPSTYSINQFNKILSKDEDDRNYKKNREKQKQKELALLKSLQEKYKDELGV